MRKNEIHFYNFKGFHEIYGKSYGDDSIYQHIVYAKMVPGIALLEQQLEIPEKFETDIVIISASNSSISRTKEYIDGLCACWMNNFGHSSLKDKMKEVLYSMLDILYAEMDRTGELIEEEEAYIKIFEELMGDSYEKFQEISMDNRQYFFHLLRLLIGGSVYRRLIIKWVVESGYKVEVWGNSWENEEELKAYYKGNIYSREQLARVYNRSRISLFTNPYAGAHVSVFEMISSKSLCLAYHNDNTTTASLKDYFKEEESIVIYKNRQELFEKIDFYMKNTDRRTEIINRGYQIIKDQKLYWEYQFTEEIENAVELAKKNMDMSQDE